ADIQMDVEQIAYGGGVFVAVEPPQRRRSGGESSGAGFGVEGSGGEIRELLAQIERGSRGPFGRHLAVLHAFIKGEPARTVGLETRGLGDFPQIETARWRFSLVAGKTV